MGLMARSQMILWVPMVLLLVLMFWAFFDRLWDTHSRRLAADVVGDIALAWRAVPEGSERRNKVFADLAEETGIHVSFISSQELVVKSDSFYIDYRLFLQERLRRRFADNDFNIVSRDDERIVEVAIAYDDGVPRGLRGVMKAEVPRGRLFISTTLVFLVFMVLGGLVFVGIATLFLRNQVRPVRRLAAAMRQFDGKGQGEDPPLIIGGAEEVREAMQIFSDMRARIRHQWQQRHSMVMAIAHDLNTVITRLKLQLAVMSTEQEDVKAFAEDVKRLEMMVKEYIEFARALQHEPMTRIEAYQLLDSVRETYADGAIRLNEQADRRSQEERGQEERALWFFGRPLALRRCLRNIADNALRFGTTVVFAVHAEGESLTLLVDDDGEGIPTNERERVFQPFYRLDGARNLDSGGVGLGLTIAREIIEGHSGHLFLEESPLGGLRVRMVLPQQGVRDDDAS